MADETIAPTLTDAVEDGPECDLCGLTGCPDADLPEFSEPVACAYLPIYEALRVYDRCEFGCARDVTKETIRRDIAPPVERILADRLAAERARTAEALTDPETQRRLTGALHLHMPHADGRCGFCWGRPKGTGHIADAVLAFLRERLGSTVPARSETAIKAEALRCITACPHGRAHDFGVLGDAADCRLCEMPSWVVAVARAEGLDAKPAPDGGDAHDGCDCTELCAMGPTCPGGMLAELPASGCHRTTEPAPDAVDRCRHGEPEAQCPSCAACAACQGECGTCPYAPSVHQPSPDADAAALARVRALADEWERAPEPPDEEYEGTREGGIEFGEWLGTTSCGRDLRAALADPDQAGGEGRA